MKHIVRKIAGTENISGSIYGSETPYYTATGNNGLEYRIYKNKKGYSIICQAEACKGNEYLCNSKTLKEADAWLASLGN